MKTAVITGASRGIGRETALKFAKEGYNIAICCIKNENLLNILKKEIENYNVKCLTYVGNIGKFENAQEMFKLIFDNFNNIDILINNAGISYIGLLSDMSIDEWNNIINVNLTSVFNCCKLTIENMVHNKSGKIINISSVWGNVGASCEVAYSASKGGINSFTKALAKELAPSNIQVNAIAFGAVDTQMNQFLNESEKQMLLDEIPAGKIVSSKEAGEFIYHISQSNEYLTGQVISFNGGWF